MSLPPLGDIFSCHAVDNPKPQSELAMLKQYGPDVPEPVLQKLVAAFGELRAMADQGTITYPYSTREVVNIVRHLQVGRAFSVSINKSRKIPSILAAVVMNMKLCTLI